MSYATEADLIAWCGLTGEVELTELTDPDNTAIDSALVAAKLEQADHEINSRLVGVELPMTAPYPKLLVDIACRIARFFLYTTGRPEYIKEDYELALKLLDDIRLRKASLGLSADESEVVAPAISPLVETPDRVFTADLLAKL